MREDILYKSAMDFLSFGFSSSRKITELGSTTTPFPESHELRHACCDGVEYNRWKEY